MFDLILAFFLARASFVAMRGRSVPATAASVTAMGAWALLVMAGWYGRGADGFGLWGVWLLAFFGPSVVPAPTERVPFSAAVSAFPTLVRFASIGCLAAGFGAVWHRASLVSPLSDEAVHRKRIALALLPPALLIAAQACLALARIG